MKTLLYACLLLLPVCATASPPAYFVSPQGNDRWSGTLAAPNDNATDGPVATPRRAQELIRTHATENGLPEGGIIYLREGTYYLKAPLYISKYESGTPTAPMLWQPFRFEKVTLVCGSPLKLSESAGGSKAALPRMNDMELSRVQVLSKGNRLPQARWPNCEPEGMPGGAWAFLGTQAEDGSFEVLPKGAVWPELGESTPSGISAVIYLDNQRQATLQAESINAAQRRIRFKEGEPQPKPGARFFLQGSPAFQSEEEWSVDAGGRELSVVGVAGDLTLASVEHAFFLEGARHVAVLGLEIVGATGDAISLQDASECLVARNTIRSAAGCGVKVQGGESNRVAGNDVLHSGAGGIWLSGGDRKTLRAGGHVAENNVISGFGEIERTHTPGIRLEGVGLRASNNLVRDGSHMGLLWQGNDHLIEGNEIYEVCRETAATGAIQHLGRDWTERGTILRNNRIHDVHGFGLAAAPDADGLPRFERPCQAWGIYLDGASSGTLIQSNEIYRVPLAGIMIAGGRDNTIENNVLVDCIPALHIDARYPGFPWAELQQRLAAMNPAQPPYSERYPELKDMSSPELPQHNRFTKNVVQYHADDYRGLASMLSAPESAVVYTLDRFDKGTTEIEKNVIFHGEHPLRVLRRSGPDAAPEILSWEAWKREGFDRASITADPEFLASEEDDYTVRRSSPAFRFRFKVIPAEKIGLYHDDFRATWPVAPPMPRPLPQHEEFAASTH